MLFLIISSTCAGGRRDKTVVCDRAALRTTALIIPNLPPSLRLSPLAFGAWRSKTTVTDHQIKSWCPKCRLLPCTSTKLSAGQSRIKKDWAFWGRGLSAGGQFIWEGNLAQQHMSRTRSIRSYGAWLHWSWNDFVEHRGRKESRGPTNQLLHQAASIPPQRDVLLGGTR